MPKFTAPISVDRHNFKEAFALSIEIPLRNGRGFAISTAYVVTDSPRCVIAKGLAERYDPSIQKGDLLTLTIIEEDPDTHVVHRYPLVIPVDFAPTHRPDYVQISLNHMNFMFEVEEYLPTAGESPEARRLDLRIRRCVTVAPDDQDELVGV